MSRQSANHPNPAPQLNTSNELNDFEEASGRATRARTRLIVEGYSNLALIVMFISSQSARIVSETSTRRSFSLGCKLNLSL